MRCLVRTLAAATVGTGAVLLGAGPASAVDPFPPAEQLTDQADVLDSGEEAEVTDALEQLQSEDGTQLYVVYVDSFSGLSGEQWADQAFDLRGMGDGDVLLAVSIDESLVGYRSGQGTPVSDRGELSDLVGTEVEPHLSDGDWTAAAVTMAQELQPGGDGGGGAGALGVIAAIAVVGGGG
jgi:uncharacterized membrane protein YgcG